MAALSALKSSPDLDTTPDKNPKGFGRFAAGLKSGLLNRVKQVGDSLRNTIDVTALKETYDTGAAFAKNAGKAIAERVQEVGTNLRNTTRTDVAFFGLSVGAGLGAKALALGAFGIASGGTTIAAAVVGGAAVGLTSALVKHIRKGRTSGSFWSRETLLSTASSTAISVATLGYSGLFEHFTGQSFTHALGQVFGKVADSVGSVGHKFIDVITSTNAFAETKAGVLSSSFVARETSGLITFADAPAPTPAPTPAPAPVLVPAAQDAAPAALPKAAAVQAPAHVATTPTPAPTPASDVPRTEASKISAAERSAAKAWVEKVNAPAAAAPTAQVAPAAPAAVAVADNAQTVTTRIGAAEYESAMEWVKKMNPTAAFASEAAVAPVPEVAEVPAPAAAVVVAEIPAPVADNAETVTTRIGAAEYESAMEWVKKMNPTATFASEVAVAPVPEVPEVPEVAEVPAPAAAVVVAETPAPVADNAKTVTTTIGPEEYKSAMEWVKKMNPTATFSSEVAVEAQPKPIIVSAANGVNIQMPPVPNAAAELNIVNKAILESGVEGTQTLDPHKMAAACVADLPASQEAFIKQNGVLPNTCVTVEGNVDMEEGSYVLVRDAAEPNPTAERGLRALFAESTVGEKEKVNDFIARVVTGETLADMYEEKRLQQVAMAP